MIHLKPTCPVPKPRVNMLCVCSAHFEMPRGESTSTSNMSSYRTKKITAFTFCPRKGTAVCQLQVEAQQHDETTCQSWTPFILIASFMYGRSAICTPWWVGYLLLDGFFNHFNKTCIHLSFKVRYPCVHVSILVFDRWLIAGWWILNPYKGNAWQRGRMGLRFFQVSKHISCHFVWCFCRGKLTKD